MGTHTKRPIEMEAELYFNVPSVVLAAVQRDGRALMYASDKVRGNEVVVLAAVKTSAIALRYASDELRHDPQFLMEVIKCNPPAFAFAPDAFRNDRTFVYDAVTTCALGTLSIPVLMCASETLRGDRAMVMHAIQHADEDGIKVVMESWWDDLEVLLFAVKCYPGVLQYAPARIRHDRDIVLAAVRVDGCALSGVPDEFQDDREIVLATVSNYGGALGCASETLRADRDVVLNAVANGGNPLCYVPDHLLDDRAFILEIVATHARYDKVYVNFGRDCVMDDFPEQYLDDFEIMHAAVAHDGHSLAYVSDRLRVNREIVLTAVSNFGHALEYASETFRNDREVVLAAVSNDGRALQYASKTLRNDREVVLAAVSNCGYALWKSGSLSLHNDRELVLAAASKWIFALHPLFFRDREIVLAALASSATQLKCHVDRRPREDSIFFERLTKLYCNDRDVMFAIVTKGGDHLRNLARGRLERHDGFPLWMQNDLDIIYAVRCGAFMHYASETLQSDRYFVLSVVAMNAFALPARPFALKDDRDVISAAINKDRRAAVYLPPHLHASYARAGPIETRLLFERMPYPFNLPWELVSTHILPHCHRV